MHTTLEIGHWPPTLSDLADGFREIEAGEVMVTKVTMSSETFGAINFEGYLDRMGDEAQPGVWGAFIIVDDSLTQEVRLLAEGTEWPPSNTSVEKWVTLRP